MQAALVVLLGGWASAEVLLVGLVYAETMTPPLAIVVAVQRVGKTQLDDIMASGPHVEIMLEQLGASN